jgi:hypothetical protein
MHTAAYVLARYLTRTAIFATSIDHRFNLGVYDSRVVFPFNGPRNARLEASPPRAARTLHRDESQYRRMYFARILIFRAHWVVDRINLAVLPLASSCQPTLKFAFSRQKT